MVVKADIRVLLTATHTVVYTIFIHMNGIAVRVFNFERDSVGFSRRT